MTKIKENFDFDEIMGITETGEIDTYDFVIPKTHCFIANGIVVHNSGDIRNDMSNIISLYTSTPEETQFDVKVRALKGKDTGRWTTWLSFDGNFQEFKDCTDPGEEPLQKDFSY